MILLDTNVMSEMWKPAPDAHVAAWMDAQVVETLYLCTIVIAELRYGIATMPAGRRRSILHIRLERTVTVLFGGRIAGFDLAAARAYGDLMAQARSLGRGLSAADGYIAAIAAARDFIVASRDAAYAAAGVRTINPWEYTTSG